MSPLSPSSPSSPTHQPSVHPTVTRCLYVLRRLHRDPGAATLSVAAAGGGVFLLRPADTLRTAGRQTTLLSGGSAGRVRRGRGAHSCGCHRRWPRGVLATAVSPAAQRRCTRLTRYEHRRGVTPVCGRRGPCDHTSVRERHGPPPPASTRGSAARVVSPRRGAARPASFHLDAGRHCPRHSWARGEGGPARVTPPRGARAALPASLLGAGRGRHCPRHSWARGEAAGKGGPARVP